MENGGRNRECKWRFEKEGLNEFKFNFDLYSTSIVYYNYTFKDITLRILKDRIAYYVNRFYQMWTNSFIIHKWKRNSLVRLKLYVMHCVK